MSFFIFKCLQPRLEIFQMVEITFSPNFINYQYEPLVIVFVSCYQTAANSINEFCLLFMIV